VTRPARLLLLALLGACSSTDMRMDYNPGPAQVVVRDEKGEAAARALLAVIGAERSDGTDQLRMRVRVRVENLGAEVVTFEGDRALLVDADLMAFDPPTWTAPGAPADNASELAVPAGENALVDLRFPFPAGLDTSDLNLDGLNLRWSVSIGDRRELLGTTFTRRRRTTTFYPYPDPYFRFHMGYGYYHHR